MAAVMAFKAKHSSHSWRYIWIAHTRVELREYAESEGSCNDSNHALKSIFDETMAISVSLTEDGQKQICEKENIAGAAAGCSEWN